jgi:hypothetical protein
MTKWKLGVSPGGTGSFPKIMAKSKMEFFQLKLLQNLSVCIGYSTGKTTLLKKLCFCPCLENGKMPAASWGNP